jgi:hypothetical protein
MYFQAFGSQHESAFELSPLKHKDSLLPSWQSALEKKQESAYKLQMSNKKKYW